MSKKDYNIKGKYILTDTTLTLSWNNITITLTHIETYQDDSRMYNVILEEKHSYAYFYPSGTYDYKSTGEVYHENDNLISIKIPAGWSITDIKKDKYLNAVKNHGTDSASYFYIAMLDTIFTILSPFYEYKMLAYETFNTTKYKITDLGDFKCMNATGKAYLFTDEEPESFVRKAPALRSYIFTTKKYTYFIMCWHRSKKDINCYDDFIKTLYIKTR